MRPDKVRSTPILGGACSALLIAYSLDPRTWPFWAQGILALATIALLPLLNSLGVFEALGVKNLPGAKFRARWMFAGIPLFFGGLLWVFITVRLVPDTTTGVIVVLAPAVILTLGGLFCFIRGTL